MSKSYLLFAIVGIYVFSPNLAHASSFEGSLQSLISAVVGKIMPICALPFVAKAAFGLIQGDPTATQQAPRVALGVTALLGINGLWSFFQSHIR